MDKSELQEMDWKWSETTRNASKRAENVKKHTFSEDKSELQEMDWKRSETTKDVLIRAENVKKHILRGQKWTSRNRLKTVRNDQR